MTRKTYKSDLTDKEWQIIKPLIPPPKPGGHPRTVDMREVVNAIFYLLRTGCSWEMLPHDEPPYSTGLDCSLIVMSLGEQCSSIPTHLQHYLLHKTRN